MAIISTTKTSLKTNSKPFILRSLLYGLLFASFCKCSSPVGYESDSVLSQYDRYVVHGYVKSNDKPVVNVNVKFYVKCYNYSVYETTYINKTNYNGYYRFNVYFEEYNYKYFTIYCNGKRAEGQIYFGKVEQIDINL